MSLGIACRTEVVSISSYMYIATGMQIGSYILFLFMSDVMTEATSLGDLERLEEALSKGLNPNEPGTIKLH